MVEPCLRIVIPNSKLSHKRNHLLQLVRIFYVSINIERCNTVTGLSAHHVCAGHDAKVTNAICLHVSVSLYPSSFMSVEMLLKYCHQFASTTSLAARSRCNYSLCKKYQSCTLKNFLPSFSSCTP